MTMLKVPAIILVCIAVVLACKDAKAQRFLKGFRFEVGGVYGQLTPGDFSEGMRFVGSDEIIGRIQNAKGFEAGIGHDLIARFGVILRAGYVFGSTKEPLKVRVNPSDLSEVVDSEVEFRIADVPVSIAVDYRISRGSFSTVFDFAGELHFLEFSDRMPEIESHGIPEIKNVLGEETTLAARGAMAVEWALASKLFTGVRAGYRVAEAAHFRSFTIDLSGLYFGIFVGFKPWA